MPKSVLEPVLHGRSVAMNDFSELVKQMNDSASTSSTQHSHHQAFSSTNSKLSAPDTATTAHSGSSAKSGSDALSCHASSSSSISISDQSKSTNNASECVPKALLATELVAQSQFIQQLPEESCHSILTVPNPMEQSRVQSPLMSGSSIDSSPVGSAMMVSPQQEFIPSPEQFLDFTSPVEMCPPPYDSATTDFGSLSGYPGDSVIYTVPQTVPGADSIPLTTSVPIPYSQTPNFVPQAPSSSAFNPQIPSDFNFLGNTSAQNFQNFNTSLCLDESVPISQTFDQSNPPLNDTSDSLMQQIVDEMMDESNFNPFSATAPSSMNIVDSTVTHSHFLATPILNSGSLQNAGTFQDQAQSQLTTVDLGDSMADFLFDSQIDVPNSSSSNSEVQDILQHFIS